MSSNPASLESIFLPEEPLTAGNPDSGDGWLEAIASELYRNASMLLGEGEEAIGLIEQIVAGVNLEADLDTCCDHNDARRNALLTLASESIALLARRDPAAFAAPTEESGPASCIEDDDLSAAGVTAAELEQMLTGPDRQRLRGWLEGLSVSLRVIFVLRAVAGLSSAEVAGSLAEHGGALAENWTPDAVRASFRQALCSLASQLLLATAAK